MTLIQTKKIKLAIGMALCCGSGMAAMHHVDAVAVQSALQSDDTSMARNLSQTNVLLTAYSRVLSLEEKQKIIDSIKRDANGTEVQE